MAKNIRFIGIILLLVCGVASDLAAPEISTVYLSQVGKMESPPGSNWGHPVQDYLARVHDYKPDPWCAAFVAWCLDSAGIPNTITASSGSAQNKANLVYYRLEQLQPGQAGDVFVIYFPALHRIGHTGFVHRQYVGGIVETVEGNSNAGGSREGVGVFRRKRPLHTLWSISRWTKNPDTPVRALQPVKKAA